MVADLLIAFLIVVGGSFVLIGSWGLARLPTLMTRLHAPTKATTLGLGSLLIASMIYFPSQGVAWSAHELLISVFLFITAPVAANMIAKAHLHRQVHRIGGEAVESEADALPRPPGDAAWATFGRREAPPSTDAARRQD